MKEWRLASVNCSRRGLVSTASASNKVLGKASLIGQLSCGTRLSGEPASVILGSTSICVRPEEIRRIVLKNSHSCAEETKGGERSEWRGRIGRICQPRQQSSAHCSYRRLRGMLENICAAGEVKAMYAIFGYSA